MRGMVITGGKAPAADRIRYELISGDTLFIVAADSGYDTAVALSLRPDLVLGDFDSIQGTPGPGIERRSYSTDKDHTDTQLGVRALQENSCSFDFLIGGGEGRLDHLLSIMELYTTAYYPGLWITGSEEIYAVDPDRELTFQGLEKRTVSIINPFHNRCKVNSHGLQWELKDYNLFFGSASISNRVTDSSFSLRNDGSNVVLLVIPFAED